MKKKDYLIPALEFLRSIALYVLITLIFLTFGFRPMEIAGTSMQPTLKNGERVLINIFHNLIQDPQRFDVVVVRHEEELWVKRVVALPNETVSYQDGVLYINDEPVEESFLKEDYMQQVLQELRLSLFTADMDSLTLGEDEYLLAGDNRPSSLDSRNARVGAFKRSDIIANGLLVFWPLNELHYVGNG